MRVTRKETRYLMTLLLSDYNVKNNRILDAGSRGDTFYDPDIKHCENLIEKLEVEIMEGKTNGN